MRHQVHRFQQAALVDLELNTEDALLLDWILNWKDGNSMERIVIGDDVAYWVSYSKVIEELPMLFKKTKGFSSELEAEKAKKANTTKVARMFKGNLSKVLTRHERKVNGKTRIYISFDRNMIDFLINYENKKAPSMSLEDANEKSSNNQYNDIINQSDINNTSYQKKSQCQNTTKNEFKYKVVSNKHNDSVNNTFIKYGDKLEEMLFKSQEGKFK